MALSTYSFTCFLLLVQNVLSFVEPIRSPRYPIARWHFGTRKVHNAVLTSTPVTMGVEKIAVIGIAAVFARTASFVATRLGFGKNNSTKSDPAVRMSRYNEIMNRIGSSPTEQRLPLPLPLSQQSADPSPLQNPSSFEQLASDLSVSVGADEGNLNLFESLGASFDSTADSTETVSMKTSLQPTSLSGSSASTAPLKNIRMGGIFNRGQQGRPNDLAGVLTGAALGRESGHIRFTEEVVSNLARYLDGLSTTGTLRFEAYTRERLDIDTVGMQYPPPPSRKLGRARTAAAEAKVKEDEAKRALKAAAAAATAAASETAVSAAASSGPKAIVDDEGDGIIMVCAAAEAEADAFASNATATAAKLAAAVKAAEIEEEEMWPLPPRELDLLRLLQKQMGVSDDVAASTIGDTVNVMLVTIIDDVVDALKYDDENDDEMENTILKELDTLTGFMTHAVRLFQRLAPDVKLAKPVTYTGHLGKAKLQKIYIRCLELDMDENVLSDLQRVLGIKEKKAEQLKEKHMQQVIMKMMKDMQEEPGALEAMAEMIGGIDASAAGHGLGAEGGIASPTDVQQMIDVLKEAIASTPAEKKVRAFLLSYFESGRCVPLICACLFLAHDAGGIASSGRNFWVDGYGCKNNDRYHGSAGGFKNKRTRGASQTAPPVTENAVGGSRVNQPGNTHMQLE